MNRKGFTLVELLATIVILSVVMGIASYGVIGIIRTSRKNTEAVFVNRIADYIDEYLTLNSSSFKFSNVEYCVDSSCSNKAYRVVSDSAVSNRIIGLNDLIASGIVDADKMVNPVNKNNCLNASGGRDGALIYGVFGDSDYDLNVAYYLSNDTTKAYSDVIVVNYLNDTPVKIL